VDVRVVSVDQTMPRGVWRVPQEGEVNDDQLKLAITPSRDAVDIDAAHKVLRDAIGTPQEAIARAYLEEVVRRVKARQEAQP
jgi:hypothetical protein